jgi:hypothetical protein
MQANILGIENNLIDPQSVVAEQGEDLEEVYRRIQNSKQLAAEYDLTTDDTKAEIDAYGIAVRAGAVTPQIEDETAIREKMKLPKPGAGVKAAWAEDGGARKPITLKAQNETVYAEGAE